MPGEEKILEMLKAQGAALKRLELGFRKAGLILEEHRAAEPPPSNARPYLNKVMEDLPKHRKKAGTPCKSK